MKVVNRLSRLIVRDDIFISYARADASAYAAGLAGALAGRVLSCCFDQWGSSPGDKVPNKVLRALRRSGMLVVIGSKEAVRSAAMRQEIETFLPTERLIVPVDLDGWLQRAEWWPLLRGLAISEDWQPIEEARDGDHARRTPSSEVVDRIVNGITFTTRDRTLRKLRTGAIATFAGFALAAVGAALVVRSLQMRTDSLQTKVQASEAQVAQAERSTQATKVQLAETDTILAGQQAAVGTLQQDVTDLNVAKTELTKARSALVKQNDELEQRGLLLRTRIAARRALDTDPVLAYRLAERAYALGVLVDPKDPESKALLLTALSQLDFPYQKSLKPCSLADFQPPLALVRCSGPIKDKVTLRVLDTESLRFADVQQPADDGTDAWIAPVAPSWRIVTRRWLDDQRQGFELWNSEGQRLGEPLATNAGGRLVRCSPSAIAVYEPIVRWFLWDLASSTRVRVDRKFDPDGPGELNFLGCSEDGTAALGGRAVVGLFDRQGVALTPSAAKADLRMPALGSMLSFASRDSNFLAIVDGSPRRPAIWNTRAPKVTQLHSEGADGNDGKDQDWGVDALAWGPRHELGYSGHTAFQRNATVEIVDAESPEIAPRVVQRTARVIAALAFSPDGNRLAVADDAGQLTVLRVADGVVVASAKHEGVKSLNWSGEYLYSSTGDPIDGATDRETRIWSGNASFRSGWVYASRPERIYGACAVSDPASHWHAVSFTNARGKAGIELHQMFGLETKLLEFDAGDDRDEPCRELNFTSDGKWVVMLSGKRLRLWDTERWIPYELPPEKPADVFKGFAYDKGALAVQAGADRDDPVERYRIEFDGPTPRLARVDARAQLFYGGVCGRPDAAAISPANQVWPRRLPAPVYPWYREARCLSKQWFARVGCRDKMIFGAKDCDIQFVPADPALLLQLYESLAWKPSAAELDAYVSASRQ